MDFTQEYDAIRQMITDHWRDAGAPRTHVHFPNEPAAPPEQPESRDDPDWPARFIVVDVRYELASFSTYADDEVDGVLVVGFLIQPGGGEGLQRADFDAFRTMVYDHGDQAELQFLAPTLTDAFVEEDFPWYIREGLFPFKRFQSR